jgi:putative FmdB family regulatory protein
MPVYEYLCDQDQKGCGHKFEEIQSFSAEPLKQCPKCKRNTLRRLFGTPNFSFIGSGFYETDYKRKEI